MKDIEPHLDLNEEEKKFIGENEDMKAFKEEKMKLFWKKIEAIKEEKKNNKEKFEEMIKEHNEQIQKIQEENEKHKQEQEKKYAQLLEEQRIEKENREREAKENEKKFKEREEELKKESERNMKDLEERLKKERDEEKKKLLEEEKRKLKEIEDKKEKVQCQFEKEIGKIKEEKIKKIEEELKGIEETFCMKEIKKFNSKEEIKGLLKKIFRADKMAKFINKNLKIIVDKNKKNIKSTEHLNIILVGPSGVGKSTLINSILELEQETETGFGKPQTMEISFYNSPKITFLRLADSRGIEKTQESGVEAICKQIENFIQKQLKTKDPDQYIHCIWYCWTGSRLELSEINVLNKLSKQYSLKTLPVIIVYTNAIDPLQSREAEKYIKEKLKLDNYFIPVLAKEKTVGLGDQIIKIKPSNLDKLKEISINLAKSAVESSCYQGLIEDIQKTIINEINTLTNIIKEKLNIEVKSIISKIDINFQMEDFYNDIINIILNTFNKYIFLDSNIEIENNDNPIIKIGDNIEFSISEQSQIEIKTFVTNYFENTLKIYKNNLNEFLLKYVDDLSRQIIEFQILFNSQNENLLIVQWTSEQLKATLNQFIYEKISKKTEIIALKNSFQFLINPLIKNFENYFISLYKLTMKKEEFQEYTKDIIPSSFDEIEQKIKEYNECINKKEAPTPYDDEEINEETKNDLNEIIEEQDKD